jgi:hypothetical protein
MLTPPLRRLLTAIEQTPRPTYRALQKAAGISSTSVVKYQLEQLAALGHIVLDERSGRIVVDNGAEFARAWDAACRLTGNEEA